MIHIKILKKHPKSVREVFKLLDNCDRLIKVTELHDLSQYSDRAVRRALCKLFELNLVVKVPDFEDLRSHFLVTQSNLISLQSSKMKLKNLNFS